MTGQEPVFVNEGFGSKPDRQCRIFSDLGNETSRDYDEYEHKHGSYYGLKGT